MVDIGGAKNAQDAPLLALLGKGRERGEGGGGEKRRYCQSGES